MTEEQAAPAPDLSKLAESLKPDPEATEAAILEEAVAKKAEEDADPRPAHKTAGQGVLAAAAAKSDGARALNPDGTANPAPVPDTIFDPDPDMSEPEPAEEKEYNVYYCARPSMRMITPKGLEIRFTMGRLITDNKDVIKYLNKEIKSGNHFVTVNEDKLTMTSTDLDPMASLKRQHIKEYLAEQAAKAAANAPRDMGNYSNDGVAPGSIKIPSTADIVAVTGDSNSGK